MKMMILCILLLPLVLWTCDGVINNNIERSHAMQLYLDQGYYLPQHNTTLIPITLAECIDAFEERHIPLVSSVCVIFPRGDGLCKRFEEPLPSKMLGEFMLFPHVMEGRYDVTIQVMDSDQRVSVSFMKYLRIVTFDLPQDIFDGLRTASWPIVWLDYAIRNNNAALDSCFVHTIDSEINDSILDQKALDLVLSKPWHGYIYTGKKIQLNFRWVGSEGYISRVTIHRGIRAINDKKRQHRMSIRINGVDFVLNEPSPRIVGGSDSTGWVLNDVNNLVSFDSDYFSYFMELRNQFDTGLSSSSSLSISHLKYFEVVPTLQELDGCNSEPNHRQCNYAVYDRSGKQINDAIERDCQLEVFNIECLRVFSTEWISQKATDSRYHALVNQRLQDDANNILVGDEVQITNQSSVQNLCFYFSGRASGQTLKMARIAKLLSLFPEMFKVTFFACSNEDNDEVYDAIPKLLREENKKRGFEAIRILPCFFNQEFDKRFSTMTRINLFIPTNESQQKESNVLFSFVHFLLEKLRPDVDISKESLNVGLQLPFVADLIDSIPVDQIPNFVGEYCVRVLRLYEYNVAALEPLWVREMIVAIMGAFDSSLASRCTIMIMGNTRSAVEALLLDISALLGAATIFELANLHLHPTVRPRVIIGDSMFAIQHPSIADIAVANDIRRELISPGIDIVAEFDKTINSQLGKLLNISDGTRLFCEDHVGTNKVPVIAFVGRLSEEKAVGMFLVAASEMLAACSSCLFLVIGSGPMRESLQVLAESLGISSVVHLIGWRPMPELHAILRNCVNIVINTGAWRELFNNANLEAMSLGVPLVTFASGGVGEYVQKPSNLWNDQEAVLKFFRLDPFNDGSPADLSRSGLYLRLLAEKSSLAGDLRNVDELKAAQLYCLQNPGALGCIQVPAATNCNQSFIWLPILQSANAVVIVMPSTTAIAAGALMLLESPYLAKNISERGRQIVSAHFTTEKMLARYISLFDNLLIELSANEAR